MDTARADHRSARRLGPCHACRHPCRQLPRVTDGVTCVPRQCEHTQGAVCSRHSEPPPTRGDCRSPRAAVRAPKASESRSLLTGRGEPALVGFLAHVSGPTIGGMSEAKNPQDKCEECRHPPHVHHDPGPPRGPPPPHPRPPPPSSHCP